MSKSQLGSMTSVVRAASTLFCGEIFHSSPLSVVHFSSITQTRVRLPPLARPIVLALIWTRLARLLLGRKLRPATSFYNQREIHDEHNDDYRAKMT